MADEATTPGAEFAALMSGAAAVAEPEAAEAPYGYTKDPKTGEERPKRSAGRPKRGTKPEAAESAPEAAPAFDRPAPGPSLFAPEPGKTPQYRKGMFVGPLTKVYRTAGRLLKTVDETVGLAVIEQAEDCAIAWDDLARTNPAVRAFLLKFTLTSAWSAVFMAHLPILLAVLMKEQIRSRIPFMKLLGAFGDEPEAGYPNGQPANGFPGGLSEADVQAMATLMQTMPGGFPGMPPGFEMPGGAT